MTAFYTTIFVLFIVELFATWSLNKAAPDSRIRQGLWRIEVACIALVFACLLVGQVWLVKIAAPAAVAVFLVRVIMRCFDIGMARFARMGLSGLRTILANMCAGILKVGPGVGAFLMGFLEVLPEALAESAESESKSTGSYIGPGGLGAYNYSTGQYDYEFGLRDEWED